MKFKNILFILLVAGAGWYGYGRFMGGMMGGAPAGMPPGGAMPVNVAEVVAKKAIIWTDFSGRLQAVDHVEIRPRVSGMLEAVHFEKGARVKKGDKLFTIDSRPYDAALSRAKAAYGLAKINKERAESLVKERALAKIELDRRINDFHAAEAALVDAKLNVEYANITAPVSGRISRAEITVGNLINSSPTPPLLTTIVSESPIYVDFDADEKTFLNYMGKSGADTSTIPVELGVSNEEGTPHKGLIKFFDNQLSISSGTIRVRAVFDNEDGKLLPGLFAHVRIGSTGNDDMILINDKAVGTDQNKKFVWVVEDGKAKWREVELGATADGMRVITKGLAVGDKVIVDGTQRIHMPDTPVTPIPVNMDGSPANVAAEKPVEAAPTPVAEEKPAEAPTEPSPEVKDSDKKSEQ